MPLQKNLIQFSLPEKALKQLREYSISKESLSLTAKRLLVSYLETPVVERKEKEEQSKKIALLEKRIIALEKAVELLISNS